MDSNYRMIVSDVSLFEDIGGGSCRCMLAEDWRNQGEDNIHEQDQKK